MKTLLLVAGALCASLTAGQALAAKSHAGASAAVAGPKQPIPYAELATYLKASPKQRASKDWWSGAEASTGAAANTSSTTSSSAAPPLAATPPVDSPPAAEPAAPPTAATPAAPVNPPPK